MPRPHFIIMGLSLSQIRQRENFKKKHPEIAKVRNEINKTQRILRGLKKKLLELQLKR